MYCTPTEVLNERQTELDEGSLFDSPEAGDDARMNAVVDGFGGWLIQSEGTLTSH